MLKLDIQQKKLVHLSRSKERADLLLLRIMQHSLLLRDHSADEAFIHSFISGKICRQFQLEPSSKSSKAVIDSVTSLGRMGIIKFISLHFVSPLSFQRVSVEPTLPKSALSPRHSFWQETMNEWKVYISQCNQESMWWTGIGFMGLKSHSISRMAPLLSTPIWLSNL